MSLLCDYLNANFSTGYTNEDLANTFLTKFGVDVRFLGKKLLAKYNMLEANFLESVTRECRGHIVKNVNGVWKTICNPFDKFHTSLPSSCSPRSRCFPGWGTWPSPLTARDSQQAIRQASGVAKRDANSGSVSDWYGISRLLVGPILTLCELGQARAATAGEEEFHNLHEGHCPIFDKSIFESEVSKLTATIKADGSLINCYWDEDVNDWKVSTSGSITPGPVSDYPITFDALFWQIFGVDKKEALSSIGKQYTIIFELCSVMNRIVSRYKNDRVYLLAIRHNETGEYLDAMKYENILGVKMPAQVSLSSVGIKTQEELVKWVEDTTQDDEDVQYKEGYVVYREGIPICKVKAKRYLSLHHIGGSDIGCTRNNIIECFFAGSIDDIYGFLVDSMKVFADGLRSKVITLNQQVNVSIHELKGLSFATQKEYALWVLSHVDKQFSAFFFANKEKLMKGELEPDAFTHWLKLSYKRFESYWKE